ncbi:MAG TPA: phenylalanine--tRNA ligase subunit alpha [Dehalococcoidia bacterium]
MDELRTLEERALTDLAAARDESAVEAWRVAYLGRKGRLTLILRSLGNLPAEERRQVGAAGNRLRETLEAALEEKRRALQAARLAAVAQRPLDVTLPGRPVPFGRLHPITQTLRDILGAFSAMGFEIVEGPEVETDYYNFEALRIPRDHPARDLWDTLWVDLGGDGERSILLRTHTSPDQVRIMERLQPPIRVVVPGKTYRHEATDATHEWMFHQVEGLAVDQGITLADLKGTLEEFARRLFGQERQVRLVQSYYPFVEPGVDLAVDCWICRGNPDPECRVCRGSGWLELLGAGMVHPEVLRNVRYDTERYTGFAFGMGVERIALARYGIDDIRHFYADDVRFLSQFR